MRTLLFCAIILVSSCAKSIQPNKKTEAVNIVSVMMPSTTGLLQPASIKATAQANNGCWHNLQFKLQKLNDFEYSLNAYGTFESKGICAAVIVEKDTTISFVPEKKGRYIFRVNSPPFATITETLDVQ